MDSYTLWDVIVFNISWFDANIFYVLIAFVFWSIGLLISIGFILGVLQGAFKD